MFRHDHVIRRYAMMRQLAAWLCVVVLATAVGAVTLTERSEAVLAACGALRAAGQQSPEIAAVAREVIAARRARDAARLVRALDLAERLLEPAGEVWDAVRVDLRAWELAEGRPFSMELWTQGRDLLILDAETLDERSLYLHLKQDTALLALGLRLPPQRTSIVPRFIPPEGFRSWNGARLRTESIVILAGRRLAVIPLMEPHRPDSFAWSAAVTRDARMQGIHTPDLDGVSGSWWSQGETWVVVRQGETSPLSACLAEAARIPTLQLRLVANPPPEGWERLDRMLREMGDTTRVMTWRNGQAVVLYDPGHLIVTNASAVTLPVEIMTDAADNLSSVPGEGRVFDLVSRDMRAEDRYAWVEVLADDGTLDQQYRLRILPRMRLQVASSRTLFRRMEPARR